MVLEVGVHSSHCLGFGLLLGPSHGVLGVSEDVEVDHFQFSVLNVDVVLLVA